MLAKELIQQTQPCGASCVSTCVAMLAGVPAKEVIKLFHDDFYNKHEIVIADMLEHYQLPYGMVVSGGNNHLSPGRVYLLTVPSLNVPGGNHEVVWDYRDAENPRVLDPAKGYPGRKYYTLDQDEIDEVVQARELFSWTIDYYILGE